MPRSPRSGPDDLLRPASRRVPFPFVLEEIEALDPITRPMFGCLAVYLGERIVFILRDKADLHGDNGLWVATSPEHGPSLREQFPDLRPVSVIGGGGGWLNLPAGCDAFEEDALRLCALVRASDPRIGKIPPARRSRPGKPSASQGAKARTPKAKAASKTARKAAPKARVSPEKRRGLRGTTARGVSSRRALARR